MPCARCSICALNFPVDQAGETCPVCDDETLDAIQNVRPDDPVELRRLANRAEFERRYGPADVT